MEEGRNPTPLDLIDHPSRHDPLSEVTRKERKSLLISCVVGIAISAGGLVPDKIEALGISIEPNQEESLYYILAGVIAYLLTAFTIYAWSDLKRRDLQVERARNGLRPLIKRISKLRQEAEQSLKEAVESQPGSIATNSTISELGTLQSQMKFVGNFQRIGTIRTIIDIYFPMVLGATCILVVWSSTDGFIGWTEVIQGAAVVASLVGAIMLFIRRGALYTRWRRLLKNYRRWRQERLKRIFQNLDPDDPRKEVIQNKIKALLEKDIDDLKNGFY